MTLSEISIKKPVFAWMLMFAMILFGLLGFFQLGINENPDVDYPTITVNYIYDGATPEVIEKDILEPVESVLVSMQGIRSLSATADRGNGSVTLEFELDKNVDFALQEVQTLLGRAQRELPGTVEPPVVTKSNAADDPIMYLSLFTETLSKREVMILFRDQIRDQISTVEGVAEVRAFGYHEPIMRIDLEVDKLNRFQLTPIDIFNSIQREHLELPAGKFEKGDDELLIRIMGEATDTNEFKNMVISRRGGAPNFVPLQVKDVAKVYEGIENLRRISRFNGVFAIGMAVQKQRGVNAVATADRVLAKLDKINENLPTGISIKPNFDRTQFIRASVDELVLNLLLSAFLTSLVCWLFLKSMSATINIILAIPTAIVGAFAFMYLFGFSLNTFSLLGLSLAIGIVVDDAIVMLENIVRYATDGYDKLKASLLGSKEITFAVIATTLALVSIFAPITFMSGIEGRFFYEFAITLCIAVSLSSIEALTLTPMRCSQFLDILGKGLWIHRLVDKIVEVLGSRYLRGLEFSLNNKVKVLIFSLVVFLSSFLFFNKIPREFTPAQDSGVLFCIFLAPDGRSMEYTNEKVRKFEEIVSKNPYVERTYVAVGGFGRGGQGNRGNGVVVLKPKSERDLTQAEVAAKLREEVKVIDGLKVFIRDRFGSAIGGRRGSPVEFTIRGPDPEKQKEFYYAMLKKMEETKLMEGIRSDDVRDLPEVHIIPDRIEARARGVEIAEIARAINISTGGLVVGQYTKLGRRFDVYVQLEEKDRRASDDIEDVFVRNNRGELVHLKDVVTFEKRSGPQNIYRENRFRALRVDANLAKGIVASQAISAVEKIAKETLGEGYYIEFSQNLDDSLLNILFIIGLGLAIAYMVLSSQFNSFVDPIIVFLAIPFGLFGSLLGLYVFGQTLNVYSMIGIMLTMGLVKKNSILIVEFTNQLRDQGESVTDALFKACRLRFRPILMTTLATLAAAVPAALSQGAGSETRIPMAVVVLAGVSISAVFTLYVIPIFYLLFARNRRNIDKEVDEILASQESLKV
ncbi:MAG: efflux RND transporter permease subunit [Bacteriovoracaceae bacterium]|nr:efflux RND transporter permease subunit [Bacteriovoracaceae bacterium]